MLCPLSSIALPLNFPLSAWWWLYAAQVGCLVYKCCASNYSSSCKKTCTCPMSLGVKYSNWSTDIMFLVAAGSSQALFFFFWCSCGWGLVAVIEHWTFSALLVDGLEDLCYVSMCISLHVSLVITFYEAWLSLYSCCLFMKICWPLPMSYFSWSNVVVIGWSLLWALPAISPSLVTGDSLCLDEEDVYVSLPLIYGGLNP